MTLDDFFTLTEMNNGLTAPSRVMELMAVMQKGRNCTANVGDSTRQWSAVASVIAATENKDCLDLFIQSDGVPFIDKWLKDTQKFSNDTNDSFAEETITHLLQALENLHVNHEKLAASEIWATVKDLLGHNSSKVQDKARILFESWKMKRDGDASILDVEKVGAFTDEMGKSEHIQRGFGRPESSLKNSSLSRDTSNKEIGQVSTRDNPVPSTSSGSLHSVHVEFAGNMDKIIDPPVGDDRHLGDIVSPSASKPVLEPPKFQSISTTLAESCIPAAARQDMLDSLAIIHELESTSDTKRIPKIENSPELGSLEKSKTADDRSFSSSSDAAAEKKSMKELGATINSVSGDNNSCSKGSSFIDSRTISSDVKDAMDDNSCENKCRNSSAFRTEEGGEINHCVLGNSSSSVKSSETPKDLGAILSEVEDDGNTKKLDLHVRDDLANVNNIAQKEMHGEPSQSNKKTDVQSDYGIEDPLEVARQVAIEVEREVVDYRGQSCSSEKLPEGNNKTGQPEGPDSVSGKQSHASERSPKDVANDPEFSTEASPMQVESATSTKNLDIELTKGTNDMETSQVTEGAQAEANKEQNLYNFDLNLEVCSEDVDLAGNQFLVPVSIVSASRAAAAPGLPASPLQFEGNLGWKGSAATSAFRPASPRRMRESDKDLSIVASNSSAKQPQGFLEIDLNVAESGDGFKGELLPHKPIPVSSSIPSGESSAETNSRSERLDLDLNLASEDGVPSNWQIGQLFPQGSDHQSRSHSSSSPSKQPSLRIIDLNDQPNFPNDSTNNSYLSKLSQNFNVSGGIKSDDAVISIMGTKVEVNRRELVPPTITLPNGRTPELTFDVNLGRTGSFLGIGSVVPYAHAHSSVYGYSNIAPGPAMPFSSTIYGPGGPIPYLVDSRGAPVIPQIVGSASSLPSAYSQPQIVLNTTSSTPSNGVGPSQSSFDLNFGTMVEGGSRDPAGFRQFLNSGPIRSMDDQLRSNTLPTVSSGAGGKRKEPDNGWEQYPFRHYTPPWK